MAERSVALSDSAVRRIAFLKRKENNPALKLRLEVQGGGCSGFQYHFSLDEAVGPEDQVFARDQAELIVDQVSLDLVAGSEIEFAEELMGAMFRVKNPNAASRCGCGTSFALA